jgi:hypothetical protein
MLADSVPRPYPFSQEASRQLAELREAASRTEAHFRALLGQREAQLRSGRPRQSGALHGGQSETAAARSEAGIVFLGDSITDGWRLNEYFPDHDFVNRGISGQITGEMLGRFKADVFDLNPKR